LEATENKRVDDAAVRSRPSQGGFFYGAGMMELTQFRTSEEALKGRRQLLQALKAMAALVLGLALYAFLPNGPLLWAGIPVCAFFIWQISLRRWLEAYATRELAIQMNAIEEKHKGFTRFILFDELEQLRVTQGKNEKILAVELRTLQGAFVLRGYENMEALFGHLSRLKPAKVIIEVEEAGMDWNTPTPWVILIAVLGILGLAILLFLK
jgi:hypothetical protein